MSTATATRPSKMFSVWMDRITAPTISRGLINQYCQNIYARAQGYEPGGKTLNLTDDEAAAIVDALRDREDGGPLVTDEQAQVGRDWLAKYWKRLGLPELDYRSITHFRLWDATVIATNWYGSRASVAPEYAAYFPDGTVLVYAPTAWQATAYGDRSPRPRWRILA